MGSADFSWQILFQPWFKNYFLTFIRSPQVRTQSFLPSICYIYTICFWIVWGLNLYGNLAQHICAYCNFCSSDQKFALELPSDSSSPRTPLLLAMCLALLTHTRDFHPLDCAHAGRTIRWRYNLIVSSPNHLHLVQNWCLDQSNWICPNYSC